MARTPVLGAVTVIAAVRAGDVVLVVDAAFLTDAMAELAIDDHLTARIVTAALGAREDPVLFVDAAFQSNVFAYRIAKAVQTADFADGAFGVATTGVFPIRDAIDAATAPPGIAAQRFTRRRTLTTDNRRWQVSRVGRCAIVDFLDRGFRRGFLGRRILRRWFFCRRLFRRWRVALCSGLVGRRNLLDDRLQGRVGFLDRWFFVLRECLAGATQGNAANKAAEQSFQHKAA
jgi:hypothetical protein